MADRIGAPSRCRTRRRGHDDEPIQRCTARLLGEISGLGRVIGPSSVARRGCSVGLVRRRRRPVRHRDGVTLVTPDAAGRCSCRDTDPMGNRQAAIPYAGGHRGQCQGDIPAAVRLPMDKWGWWLGGPHGLTGVGSLVCNGRLRRPRYRWKAELVLFNLITSNNTFIRPLNFLS